MQRELNTKTNTRFQFARYWTIRGFTASLIVIAALLPVVSALSISFWLDGEYNWREAALELGVACLTLSLIAYPAFYLLNWESDQAQRWDETQQDFRLLIDQAVDMVFLVSLDGRIVEVNQRACESMGYSKVELKNLSILDIDIDCYLHRHPKLVNQMQNGESITYQTRYRSKSGNRIPVESRARMASWLEEPHYLEFVSDISHRLEVEKQIDESREALEKTRNILERRIAEHSSELKRQKQSREMAERYANSIQNYLEKLIDSMPSAIIAVDEDHQVMQWNIEAEKMTNIQAKMAIGEKLSNLFPALYQHMQSANSSKDLLQQSLNFRFNTRINHENRTLEVMIYPIFTLREEEQGEVIRIDDITEKVKIDETLVQTEKMLSLGGLAAGMAHEINNPLGAIMQSTQNIKRRLSNTLARNQMVAQEVGLSLDALHLYLEKQRILEFLEGVMISGERAAHIVGDMLSFARPANQESTQVSLQDALDAAVRLSAKDYNQRKQFDFRKIEMRKTYSPLVGCVLAQKNQLEQVFLNMLINAAQALALNKDESFHPLIELIIRREGNMACVEIIDNGPGMDEATRKRVFEPFFTTKDENVGTGLGLSVSYFIVCEQLGGRLSVESQPGKGCRFTIHLPLVRTESSAQDAHDEQIELPL
ncbi:PAS domain-containing sensor histidine kinase [Aliikangiella coralliicola]|uniref:histidine kinase n=1 Tax=Aliikangiella coralliicola TaxID=2592383 RepID=A0A545UI72_9GAMM|nr:PAS domain S-box protein [Aliikangiella coralliicola]TQV89160.1 PAS domain S-box protein [Aliikangiella coralliicola]